MTGRRTAMDFVPFRGGSSGAYIHRDPARWRTTLWLCVRNGEPAAWRKTICVELNKDSTDRKHTAFITWERGPQWYPVIKACSIAGTFSAFEKAAVAAAKSLDYVTVARWFLAGNPYDVFAEFLDRLSRRIAASPSLRVISWWNPNESPL